MTQSTGAIPWRPAWRWAILRHGGPVPEAQRLMEGGRSASEGWRSTLLALRARQWRHFLLLPIVGQGMGPLNDPSASWRGLLLGALVAAGCLGWAYGLNALTDRESDLSSVKNPLVAHSAGPGFSWLLGGCLLATSLLAARIGGPTATAATISLVAGAVYSAGPRLKARPLWGTVVNCLIFAPLPLLGAPTEALSWPPLWLLVAVFVALLCHNQLLHELADADEDRAGGVRSTAATLGPTASTAGAVAVATLALALTATARDMALAGTALGVLMVSVLQVSRCRSQPAARLRQQHRLLSLLGGGLLWAIALAWGAR